MEVKDLKIGESGFVYNHDCYMHENNFFIAEEAEIHSNSCESIKVTRLVNGIGLKFYYDKKISANRWTFMKYSQAVEVGEATFLEKIIYTLFRL